MRTPSNAMDGAIFDWPAVRSRNVNGISTMRSPARCARCVVSTWKT